MLAAARIRSNRSASGVSSSRSAKRLKRSLIGASSHTVILAAQMRGRARPSPVLRPLHQPCAHRVERYIAQCRREIFLIHGNRAEPVLPERTRAFASGYSRNIGRLLPHVTKGAVR